MVKDESQEDKVPGVKLGLKNTNRGGLYGDIHEEAVGRTPGGQDVKRTVQIVPLDQLEDMADADRRSKIAAEIRKNFEERTSKLLNNPLPQVSPIYNAGTSPGGSLFVVRARHETWLYDKTENNAGWKVAKKHIESIVEQLLTGLASLHAAGIPYGDLRLEDIQIDCGEGGQTPILWITGTEFGGLKCWSDNCVTCKKHRTQGLPPEWEKQACKPTYRADLYLLGLLICQIAEGREVSEGAKIGNPVVKELVTKHLLKKNPDDRPEDAGKALKEFKRLQRQLQPLSFRRVVTSPLCLGLVVVALVAVVLWNSERLDLAETSSARESLKKQVKAKDNEIQKLKREDAEILAMKHTIKEQNATNRELLEKLGIPSSEEPPRDIWGTAVSAAKKEDRGRKGGFAEFLAAVADNVAKALKNAKLEPLQRAQIDEWRKDARDDWNQHAVDIWIKAGELTESDRRHAVEGPWSAEAKSKLKLLRSLEAASSIWKELKGVNSADGVDKVIDGELAGKSKDARPAIRDQLAKWMKDFETTRKWTFRISKATTEQESQGENWLLTIYVDGNKTKSLNLKEGSYEEDERPEIEFDWQPGQSIRVFLEGDWFLTDPTRDDLIDKTYSSRYAIWELHKDGQCLTQDSSTLKFKIENCPGPPREKFEPMPSTPLTKPQ